MDVCCFWRGGWTLEGWKGCGIQSFRPRGFLVLQVRAHRSIRRTSSSLSNPCCYQRTHSFPTRLSQMPPPPPTLPSAYDPTSKYPPHLRIGSFVPATPSPSTSTSKPLSPPRPPQLCVGISVTLPPPVPPPLSAATASSLRQRLVTVFVCV